jgi:hypothetical protein
VTERALFVPDDGDVVPTDYARGPWDPNALHGGPVAALLARAVEGVDRGGVDVDVARLTVELLRPVPLAPLTVEAHVVRPGKKVQLVEAVLAERDSGAEVARARALSIRRADVPIPYDDPGLAAHLEAELPPPGPAEGTLEQSSFRSADVAFHTEATEHRFVAGTWNEAGPVTVWIRLKVPVIAGEVPTGLQRAMAAADFGNGVARVLPFETHLFINPDLTVHLLRPPDGEWIGMATRSHIGPAGVGLAESALYDESGRVGRSVQSLLVDIRT